MAIKEVLVFPHPILRQKCTPVVEVNDEIRSILHDMADTMHASSGIGLAAPQIGHSWRLIVVDVGPDETCGEAGRLYKIVNPVIVKSEGSVISKEGCLCFPGIYETFTRKERVLVKGLDEQGKELSVEATGMLSNCLQHEIDHLDGILIIDHISRLRRELVKAKLKKKKKEQ